MDFCKPVTFQNNILMFSLRVFRKFLEYLYYDRLAENLLIATYLSFVTITLKLWKQAFRNLESPFVLVYLYCWKSYQKHGFVLSQFLNKYDNYDNCHLLYSNCQVLLHFLKNSTICRIICKSWRRHLSISIGMHKKWSFQLRIPSVRNP